MMMKNMTFLLLELQKLCIDKLQSFKNTNKEENQIPLQFHHWKITITVNIFKCFTIIFLVPLYWEEKICLASYLKIKPFC